MEKIISSIPVYNLLTNLIPGTVLAALLKFCVKIAIYSLLQIIYGYLPLSSIFSE